MRLMDRMPHLIISRGKVSKEYMKKKQLEDRELMKANPLSEFNIKSQKNEILKKNEKVIIFSHPFFEVRNFIVI